MSPTGKTAIRQARNAYAENSTSTRRWAFFGVVSLGLFMIGLDNSILYTALPELNEQLHTTSTQALWIINAYPLVLSGLLLGTGTLGDRIGHRCMFTVGLSIFGLASLAAAFAPGAWALVTARAFLGFGAATMMPATLALIRLTFDDEQERNTAIGIWGSIAVVGAASGPVVGGFLLEHFWWGSIFLINVPLVVVALALTARLAPPNITNPEKSWDIVSSLWALITLSGFTMVIKEAAREETNLTILGAAVACFLAGAVLFVRRQNRLTDPLLTFDIFRSRLFAGGVLAAAGAMFIMAGVELLTTQKLQLADQFSPLQAGLSIAAVTICAFPASAWGGANLHRVGFLPLIAGGFLVVALGIGSAIWAAQHDTFPLMVVGMMFTGLGAGMIMSVSSIAIIGAAPLHRTGMAAGVEEVSYEFGTLISVAVTGSLMPLFFLQNLPAHLHNQGMEALYSETTQAVAADAYNTAYIAVVTGLGITAALFALITGWCFRDNPKSGGNGGAH